MSEQRTSLAAVERLRGVVDKLVEEAGALAVAVSGGVDSSCLLAFAARVAPEKIVGVHVASELTHPADAEAMAALRAACPELRIERVEHEALAVPAVRDNARDRCYHCKKAIMARVQRRAAELGIEVVCEGSQRDDRAQHRPGRRALSELGIRAPFVEAEMGKPEVRALARELRLEVASRPATACLATRLPYGVRLDKDRLERVGAAEVALLRRGYAPLRLRDHGDVARLELGAEQLGRALEERETLVALLRGWGWRHVTLDLAAFRSGSFDEE